MIKDENEEKIPLLEILDDALRNAFKNAKIEDMMINQEQWEVMQNVCKTLSNIIGGEAKVTMHPIFSAGYITLVVSGISLSDDEIETLKSTLENCTALSIDPLTNGSIECGITIPNVLSKAEQ